MKPIQDNLMLSRSIDVKFKNNLIKWKIIKMEAYTKPKGSLLYHHSLTILLESWFTFELHPRQLTPDHGCAVLQCLGLQQIPSLISEPTPVLLVPLIFFGYLDWV